MKRLYIIFFIFSFHSVSSIAQNNPKKIEEIRDKDCGGDFEVPNDKLNEIYANVCFEKLAHYSDGYELLNAFIRNNFKVDKNIENKKGRIIIEFIVERDGSLSNYKVIRDLGFNSGLEVIRILKLTKGWVPASHKGKILRTRIIIPILIDFSHE